MAYLGEEIPKLGFGLMRLPKTPDGKTDVEQVKEMVDLFMESGFTYFDTARAYGDSEAVIKEALVDRYPRESYQLATKNAAWLGAKTKEEAEAFFDTSLETTGAGYFDFYLLHNLDEVRGPIFDRWDIWDFLAKKRDAGLIKHLGCSIHATADYVDRILTEHPEMEFVQLQINYADWDDPIVQSRKCLEVCYQKHGVPVIIMEPVKGGYLATPPETVSKVLREADPDASEASWAIKFAASLPGVITVLSGMSNIEQMRDNVSFMKGFTGLDEAGFAVIDRAREELAKVERIPCTACRYCEHACPQEIPIAGIMAALNSNSYYGNLEMAKGDYDWEVMGGSKASDCIQCRACEAACPQRIEIVELLEEAVALFE